MNVGESQQFDYTGGVQSFTAPYRGIYKLEVWGAKGGDTGDGDGSAGAAGGGYAKGYITLTKGQKVYIVVGGQGGYAYSGNNGPTGGGYNGGGKGWQKFSDSGHRQAAGGGGGATHIATTNRGVLSNYASYTGEVLIVAGGAAGARLARYDTNSFAVLGAGGSGGTGGGYGFGYGCNGATGDDWANSGGGGGWSGGSVNNGGTNYVGGVTSWNGDSVASQSNRRSGNGYAKITLMKKKGVKIGNTDCVVYLGSTEISSIYNGGTEL